MTDRAKAGLWSHAAEWWQTLLDYLGVGRRSSEPLTERAALRRFIEERASHVAQTSLYGYMRTRAGQRYPELFDDAVFIVAINAAKWHVWLDCLGDLAVYSGGLLARQGSAAERQVAQLMRETVDDILRDTAIPAEAGGEFAAHADRVRERIAHCHWSQVGAGEEAFTTSPASLVQWAPIVDQLKELDEEIVLNSVRFRWQEVRRELQQLLDTDAILRETR